MADELDVGGLYREHGDFVGRVLERLTGMGAHVDDLLQECFVAAFRSRNKFDPDRAAVTTWLYSIAANIARRHHRGAFRFGRLKSKLSQEDLREKPTQPDEVVDRDQQIAAVHEVLEQLPFKQREVFALYELEGLDGPSIAEMVGVPEGTVWTRLHHARKNFTKRMRHRMTQEGNAR